MPIPYVTEQTFEKEVVRSELPVLAEFAADCPPTRMVAPEVEAVARELEGKVKVVRIDIDKSRRLAQLLKVQNVPTFVVFVKGRPVTGEQGGLRKNDLLALLDPYLPRPEGAIKPAELAQLIQQGQVVPIDTRDAAAYGRAHIPTAVNFPLEEIETRLAELHMLAGEPVLYCRSGDKSRELADKLTAGGMPVGFLEGGFLAWEGSLLPVERPD
ncbi:MAG: thioredoxin [Polyangiaceae bacterium]|nr:thioredoxin [Polyangiaceae bacterium]